MLGGAAATGVVAAEPMSGTYSDPRAARSPASGTPTGIGICTAAGRSTNSTSVQRPGDRSSGSTRAIVSRLAPRSAAAATTSTASAAATNAPRISVVSASPGPKPTFNAPITSSGKK